MELIARRRELDTISAALDRAVGGRRTVVLLRGEAGIGKTCLIDRVVVAAHERGATVVRSSATEIEADLGWTAIADVLRWLDPGRLDAVAPWHREALEAVTGRRPGDGSDPGRTAVALAELLRRVSSEGPLVLVLDDVQWLDRASASALAHALRHLDDRPVLVAAACRPVPLPIEFERIAGDDLVVVEPSPLSMAAARLMLEAVGVRLGRVDLVRVHEATGGNPLHLTETVRLLQAGASVDEALVPVSLREIIDVDITRVGREHIEVLATAAVMPQPTVALLEQMFEPDRVERALAAAEELQVLRIGARDDSISFRHPLVRSGLADRLPTVVRRRVHRRCAELDVPASVRAFHLGASVSGPDPVVADELERAAIDAFDAGLLDVAMAHVEAALAATEPGHPSHPPSGPSSGPSSGPPSDPPSDASPRRRRELFAARVALAAGEVSRSSELVQPWLDELDARERAGAVLPADAAEVVLLAARVAAGRSGSIGAVDLLRRAFELAPAGSEARASAADDLALALMYGAVDDARAFVESALAGAAHDDDRLRQVLASSLAITRALSAMPVDPVDTDPASAPTFAVLEDQLSVAVWTDDHRRAEEVIAEARRRVEWRRSSTAVHNIVQQEFDLRARQGRLEEAAQVAEQAWMLALDEESMIGRASDLVILATLRGDHETVERHLAVLARIVASGSPTLDASPIVRAQRLHAVGVADLAGGRVAAAIEHLSAAVAAFDEAGVLEVGAMPIAARLAEALVSGDRLDEAERLADELAVRAERSGRVRSRAEAARALADVRAARGDLDGAAALAAEALAGFDALGMPVERVRTQLLVAAVARRRRRRGEARVALEDARAIAVRCGALGMLPRIDAELDRLGERVGDGELTRTERQVVELVARGRSNAEIAAELHLSVRTVESNLTRVYRKLGVRSRAELIAGRSRQ